MSLEVAFSYELLIAAMALERPFTSVGSHVGFEVSRLRKFLEAFLERAQ